jgi:hypothetical protein
VLVVRRVQAQAPPHLLVRKLREPKKSTVNPEAAVKDKSGFRERYFLADRAHDNERMKEQARRHKLLGERHEFSEEKAWRLTLRLLEQDSPDGASYYKKRMETIRLPDGIFARWLRDPGESILEVMQRTGSHVQVVPGKDVGLFSSLTLLGTTSQNAAAKKLLQESDFLGAVSRDDLDALKSLADYHLRSEISDRHGKAVKENDDKTDEETDESLYDLLDDLEMGQLENIVDTVTETPTRAVWSRSHATFDVNRTAKKTPGDSASGITRPTALTSAVSLTARIEDLTANIPRHVWLKRFKKLDLAQTAVRDELVALLTNPENAHLVTSSATGKALQYLARHMQFPTIREIMNALKDIKWVIDVGVFNNLLAAAAQAENTHAFHYLLYAMRARGLAPNAGTWIHFLTLMMKRFPDEADKVRSSMQSKSIDADLSTKIESLENYSVALLESFIDSYPEASFKDFVKTISDDMPGVRWLTCFSANKMCHHLLKTGNTSTAFEVVDELVIRGGRPDVVTLNTFLGAAERDGNMEMAVAVLRKFHDLNAKSTPLAGTNADRFTTLPRVHDLSISLNSRSFLQLSSLAWERKYFNCFRVFWRYSCCAGHANSKIHKKIRDSISFAANTDGTMTRTDKTTSDRAQIWNSWAARFAIGVKAGIDSQSAARVSAIARGVQKTAGNDAATVTTPTASSTQSQQLGPLPLLRDTAKTERLRILAQDPTEVQSLHPTRLFVEVAEEAFHKDREWKHNFIGLPKGLKKLSFKSYDQMFEYMLQDGVEVPVEVGDATTMEL